MKHAKWVVAVMSVVVAIAVLSQSAKVGAAGKQLPIPLKVTFYTIDTDGQPYALRGHPAMPDSTDPVVYSDRSGSAQAQIDAYITKDGDLVFHMDCDDTQHIDLSFNTRLRDDPVEPGQQSLATVPEFEGQMTSFRITTSGLTGKQDFRTMAAGTAQHPIMVQFWTPVDEYAWNLFYDWDLPPGTTWHGFSKTGVDINAEYDADKKRNDRWILTPRHDPTGIQDFAGALFEKYSHKRPQPGYYTDYGTWVMPFKIVLEDLQ